ncbi:hypothetical protein SPRG_08830 [Saprolegnia parasitica CBS 223.65]|uniref:Uncharacterized protein n=1 Tax=Saprolegnia parasitica (strain CBS 223.65) TaxID=695850 RepID=A0A067C5U7_SAPPC|nr:hypothetical protein SPRG_08830 [Saprolegnia parasitica CBS 223.65]KDO25888.1 hypothetical protein SPRG_08830 [Saprolegnia parasitica CBS 223.65]|eukprot:XP_012203449.1 hypothetical protein SPRG_08830 [Saprolegnia parasitica CBS 223.65]
MRATRALHTGSNVGLADYMLVPYTLALTMSSTMALVTCVVVFKWASVKRHASQGALFMFFACTVVWSAVTFVGCIAKYLDDRETNWNNSLTKYTFLVAQIFQVGAALWLLVAVHEIKRMVFAPRSAANSKRAMRFFVISIDAFLFLYGMGMILYVRLHFGADHDDDHDDDQNDHSSNSTGFGHEEQLNFFEALQWGHSLLRVTSVLYPIGISLYFHAHRFDIERLGDDERGKISHRQVQLIGLLNAIATVPICLTETSHYDTYNVFVQLAQFSYYLSGTVSSFAVGCFLPRFDKLLQTPRSSAAASFVSSPPSTERIYILETRQ